MKRFISYLYEYTLKQKTKNVGFVRVDVRDEEVKIELHIRNYRKSDVSGKVYAFVAGDTLRQIEIGDVQLKSGECEEVVHFNVKELVDEVPGGNDVVGIMVQFEQDSYLASCWENAWEREIANGNFKSYENEISNEKLIYSESEIANENSINSENEITEVKAAEIEGESKITTTYKKIEINQIRQLPSPNWHLCNNSFLVHGAFNYGFLFLRKKVVNEETMFWLGVPGFYEKPEMLMAALFGFLEFEAIPKSVVNTEMNVEIVAEDNSPMTKENQEPQTGIFGAWFVKLEQ